VLINFPFSAIPAEKDVFARWLKASRALKKEDQIYGQKLAEMAKKHSSEAFYALDDPLEAGLSTKSYIQWEGSLTPKLGHY
jgi:hypothetical protein